MENKLNDEIIDHLQSQDNDYSENGKYNNNNKKHGEWSYYYSNGETHSFGKYKDGKLHGSWIVSNPNGSTCMMGSYKNGEKDQCWAYWTENGKIRKEIWKNGEFIPTSQFMILLQGAGLLALYGIGFIILLIILFWIF